MGGEAWNDMTQTSEGSLLGKKQHQWKTDPERSAASGLRPNDMAAGLYGQCYTCHIQAPSDGNCSELDASGDHEDAAVPDREHCRKAHTAAIESTRWSMYQAASACDCDQRGKTLVVVRSDGNRHSSWASLPHNDSSAV